MASIAAGQWAVITVSGASFTNDDIGREFWKKYDAAGAGGGRARIMQIVDTDEVLCKILSDFDTDDAIDAENFYYTNDVISGLGLWENEQLTVQVDGGNHRKVVVEKGKIKLDQQASVAFVGYGYRSTLKTLNIDQGGASGSAQAKPRSVVSAVIDFLHTLGAKFGTTFYNLETLLFRSAADKNDRPPPLFTGNKDLDFYDNYDRLEKKVVIIQDTPAPCTVRAIDITVDTTDED